MHNLVSLWWWLRSLEYLWWYILLYIPSTSNHPVEQYIPCTAMTVISIGVCKLCCMEEYTCTSHQVDMVLLSEVEGGTFLKISPMATLLDGVAIDAIGVPPSPD